MDDSIVYVCWANLQLPVKNSFAKDNQVAFLFQKGKKCIEMGKPTLEN
jgi:hypothetical protein